jgi:5-methylcytosine-specific restriction endonuclease McrA
VALRRPSIPAELREAVYQRDAGICWYCGLQMHPTHPDLAWDHQVPQGRGGQTTLDNIVICCMPCNNDKSTLTVETYRGVIRDRLKRQTEFVQRFLRGTKYEGALEGLDWSDFRFFGERQ